MESTKFKKNEANEILVSIIKNIPIGIIAFDLKGEITVANELAKLNLGIPYTLKELSQKNIADCISDIPHLNNIIKDCLSSDRKPFKLNNIVFQGKYLLVVGNPIISGMIVSIEDITEKKESEKVSLKALIKGQEEERKRIAKEIHDGLGPMISAIKMHVEAVQNDLNSIENDTLLKLDKTYSLIDDVANDMRSLSHDLMPKIVEDFGLAEALDSMSNNQANEKTDIIFTHNIGSERFNKNVELNLFRIAQELIHNSLKHSGAEKISLQLLKHTDSLILMVEDNGNGFSDKKKKEYYGIGLRNIKTRVKALGGVFTIDSVPKIGVTASVEITLPPKTNSGLKN